MTSLADLFPPEALTAISLAEEIQTRLFALTKDSVAQEASFFVQILLDDKKTRSFASGIITASKVKFDKVPLFADLLAEIGNLADNSNLAFLKQKIVQLYVDMPYHMPSLHHLALRLRQNGFINDDLLIPAILERIRRVGGYDTITYSFLAWQTELLREKCRAKFDELFQGMANMRMYDDIYECFNPFVDEFDALVQDDYRLLREVTLLGYKKVTSSEAILKDDIKQLAGCVLTQKVACNPYEHSGWGHSEMSLLELAALHGSVQCFEYLAKVTSFTKYVADQRNDHPAPDEVSLRAVTEKAIVGGSVEIISACEKLGAQIGDFTNAAVRGLDFAVFMHVHDHGAAEASPELLDEAVKAGNIPVIKFCLESGVSVNDVSKTSNMAALTNSCCRGRSEEVLDFLFTCKGADFTQKSAPQKESLLTLLARRGDLKKAKIILEKHPELLNDLDTLGNTALMAAAGSKKESIVEYLLSINEVNVTCQDINGKTALHHAACGGDVGCLKRIFSYPNVDPNLTEINGLTPLHLAVESGSNAAVEFLLHENKVDVNLGDNAKATPLILAVFSGNIQAIKAILACGRAEINKRDENGETALFAAASSGNVEIVKMILATPGVDAGAKNNEGVTPKERAIEYEFEEVAALLP
ncbi:hypothetical protein TRFO_41738 [Tritrichomonas foetus]|uniref:Uncharacterized protein n=1 Tax=Tritrichomonas foetus TaxID=1144522 RepID=A0A1J4KZ98_9EUKA|nr:hypothetical protein TRFO_41738 [Tritrichomonas foetus]|eukprot:OHT16577.1 hypothetical protein TRFO_41738 [Tritrichomonas foetus]